MATGEYHCGTAGDRRSRECHRNCGETPKYTWRRKVVEEHLPQGRPRSPERIQVESMSLGSTLLYPNSMRRSLRALQCMIADRKDGTSLKVRIVGDEIVVNYVPKIEDMEVGESRLYTDDFDLVMRMTKQRNTRYLDGREDRAYGFDLVGKHYHLRRLR
jgi:hypothetical protein